jgi:hypothetical protein
MSMDISDTSEATERGPEKRVATCVRLTPRVKTLLRRLALGRAIEDGGAGRVDASALVADLIEREAKRVGKAE